jgi:hypothetical protein
VPWFGFGPGVPSAMMPAAPSAAGSSGSPVLTCVNTTSGVALSWAPYRAAGSAVTYTVYQCDRTSTPGQPGCTVLFTTDMPQLVGPISLGYDYLVEARVPPNVVIVSNRVSL